MHPGCSYVNVNVNMQINICKVQCSVNHICSRLQVYKSSSNSQNMTSEIMEKKLLSPKWVDK